MYYKTRAEKKYTEDTKQNCQQHINKLFAH